MQKRTAGVLLHISSLPSEYGIGDFGPEAYKFADFLADGGQSRWQILPLNPPVPEHGNYSPYNGASAFAGNTLLISPELLCKQGLLDRSDIRNKPDFPETYADFRLVNSCKNKLFDIAYENFQRSGKNPDYQRFCAANKPWLDDYAIFVALQRHFHNQSPIKWPPEFREQKKTALEFAKNRLAQSINREKFLQYIFFRQWLDLKNYCHKNNIKIIGDIPFYVACESCDVWTRPEIFKLTKERKPRFIAGVPPDAFSSKGQLWNNPVYDWNVLKKTGYRWWLTRIRHNLNLFDIVRLDHFRGFAAYWEIPAGRRDAVKGKWTAAGGEDFFRKIFTPLETSEKCEQATSKKSGIKPLFLTGFAYFPVSSFIAEDLGRITPDVIELRDKFRLAGTRVLLFGFGKNPQSPHRPQNYVKNCVLYTGTHDTNTAKGWFENEADGEQKKKLFDFLARPWARSRLPLGEAEGKRRRGKISAGKICWKLIQLAMNCAPDTTIVPMQDILGLGEEARMNHPATVKGNWRWRLSSKALKPSIAKKLRKFTEISGRIG